MAETSAVIVHYRTPAETLRAVRSLADHAPEGEVVVIDNASGDGIAEILARKVPRARVVAEPENRGYGAACNRGGAETSGGYVLFLNSDRVVQPGAVRARA